MKRKPDVLIEVYLTPSGYQADVINAEGHRLAVCQDFDIEMPVPFWKLRIVSGFFDMLKKIKADVK